MVRHVLKLLHGFAKKELEEKRAEKVLVCRAKMRSWMRRGRIPDFQIRGLEGAPYFVCVFRGSELTVYFMDEGGSMLGASEFSGGGAIRWWESISSGARVILRLP